MAADGASTVRCPFPSWHVSPAHRGPGPQAGRQAEHVPRPATRGPSRAPSKGGGRLFERLAAAVLPARKKSGDRLRGEAPPEV